MPHVSRLNLPANPKSSTKWGRWPARSRVADEPLEEDLEVTPVVLDPPVEDAPVKEVGTPETVSPPADPEAAEPTGTPVVAEGVFRAPESVAGF